MVDTTSKAVHILGGDSTEYVRSMEAAKRATDATVAAAEKLGVTQEKENRASRMRSDFIDREVRKGDERLQAQARYEAKLAQIARAEQQGIGTAEQRAMLIERHTNILKKDIAAIEAAEKAQKAKSDADRLDMATANQIIGGIDKHARALSELNQKIADAAKIRQAGHITLQEEIRLRNLATDQYRNQVSALNVQETAMRKSATATGLARHEMINLSRQIQDVGVSLAGGQSPLRVLIEQGSQIADIFASSRATIGDFFRSATSWAGRFIGSTTAVVVGVASIGLAAAAAAISWQSAQKDIERSLLGIGAASGLTVGQVNRIATEGASATRLSTSEAREAAIEFINTGRIYQENVKAAVLITDDFARAMGMDSTKAAKDLAKALADPIKGAEQLNEKFGFLDGKTREYIASLVRQNREQEAQKALMDAMAPSIARAAELTSGLAKAWDAVTKAASQAVTAVGQALASASDEDKLAAARERQAALAMGGGRRRDIGPGRVAVEAMRGDNAALEAINREIERLEANLRKAAEAAEDQRFKRFSDEADNAVRALIPQIAQIQALEAALADLTRAQENARVSGKMGLADELQAATAAAQLQLRITKENKQETERQVAAVSQLGRTYSGVSIEVAKTLSAQRDQLNIAKARTGEERLVQQEIATQNRLLLEGKSLEEAMKIAAGERRIAQEAINRSVEEQTRSLQQQIELIRARREGTEAEVEAAQAYRNAIRQGADATTAAALAAATLALRMERAADEAEQFARSAGQALSTMTSSQWSSATFGGNVMGGLTSSAPLGGGIAQKQSTTGTLPNVGTITQAPGTIGGFFYKGQVMTYQEALAAQRADRAAYDAMVAQQAAQQTSGGGGGGGGGGTSGPSVRDIESAFENAVASQLLGGKTAAEVNAMIEAGQISGGTPSSRFQAQLDLYERAGMSSQQTIDAIRSGVIGEGVESGELLSAIDRLTNAVNSNTDAIEIGLSPFYTSQGDRALGYRGYSVQRGVQSTGGQIIGTIGSGGMTGGAIMGGTINTWGSGSIVNYPTGGTAPAPTSQPGGISYPGPYVYDPTKPRSFATYLPPGYTNTPSPYDISQPRYFAEGGVAERPTFGVFGEAGPEAFVPLKGGAIPVRFGGNVVLELVSQMLQRMNVQAGGTKANVEINAPLVHFAAEPSKDEVRESGYQAAQGLRRIIQAAA